MIADVFVTYSADKLTQLSSQIQDCLKKLSNEQIWKRNSENENAVGNLVLHLCGNVNQWIGSGVAGNPDHRVRDREFTARGEVAPTELGQRLASTVEAAAATIRGLTADRLQERINVQKYDVTVLEAVYHVIEHFSQHTGQILFATKLLTSA
ncbi:MAG: DinB family protein [Bryobacteraceae bacterium]